MKYLLKVFLAGNLAILAALGIGAGMVWLVSNFGDVLGWGVVFCLWLWAVVHFGSITLDWFRYYFCPPPKMERGNGSLGGSENRSELRAVTLPMGKKSD